MLCSKNELNDQESQIINKYTALVKSCVLSYINNTNKNINNINNNYNDLLQEAFIALILSFRSYNDMHDCSFSTLAYICINNRLRNIKHNVYYNVELEELKGRDIINIREFLPDSLTILEKEIIYFRLYNYTFREISEYYGININTIKSKYGRIIKKIQIANRVDI